MKKWQTTIINTIVIATICYGFYFVFTENAINYANRSVIVQSIMYAKDEVLHSIDKEGAVKNKEITFEYVPCLDCTNMETAKILINSINKEFRIEFIEAPKQIINKSLIVVFTKDFSWSCGETNIDNLYVPTKCRKI